MSTIRKREIPTAALLQVPLLKIFRRTGTARFAASTKTTLNLWNSTQWVVLVTEY